MLERISNITNSLPRRNLISGILAGVITLIGCKKTPEINSEVPTEKTEARITKKEDPARALRGDCNVVLGDIIELQKNNPPESLDIEGATPSNGTNNDSEIDSSTLRRLKQDELKISDQINSILDNLNECKLDEKGLRSYLSNLTNIELINLMKAIGEGKIRFLTIDFQKPELIEISPQTGTKEEIIINVAFDTIFERGIKKEELSHFLNLIDLIDASFDTPYLNEENIEKFNSLCLRHLKEELDETKDLKILSITALGKLGEKGGQILLDFVNKVKNHSNLEIAFELLVKIAETNPEIKIKLKEYLWTQIRSPHASEELKLITLEATRLSFNNRKFCLIDKEDIPTLMEIIKTGSTELMLEAISVFDTAKGLSLVKPEQAKEMGKFLFERSKNGKDTDACIELRQASEWGHSEAKGVFEKVCETGFGYSEDDLFKPETDNIP